MSLINEEKYSDFIRIYTNTLRDMLLTNYSNITTEEIEPIMSNYMLKIYNKTKCVNFSDDSLPENNDNNSSKEDLDKRLYCIAEFIFLTDFNAYFGKLDIDIDRIEKEKFGYKDHSSNCLAFIKAMGKQDETEYSCNQGIENGVLAVSRELVFDDYLKENLYLNDVQLIFELLLNDVKHNNSDKDLESAIDERFKAILNSECEEIRKRYSRILESAFSIYDYAGVYTSNLDKMFVTIKNKGLERIEPNHILNDSYNKALLDYLDVVPSASRQFDFKEIKDYFDEHSEENGNIKPVYFPYKILELVQRKKVTKNIKVYSYKDRLKDCNTLEKYLDYLCGNKAENNSGNSKIKAYQVVVIKDKNKKQPIIIEKNKYLSLHKDANLDDLGENKLLVDIMEYPFFRQNILEFCIYICKELLDYDNEKLKILITDKGKFNVNDDEEAFYILKPKIQQYLDYYVDCVTTAIVLSKFSVKRDRKKEEEMLLFGGYFSNGKGVWNIEDYQIKLCARLKQNLSNVAFVNTLNEYTGNIVNNIDDESSKETFKACYNDNMIMNFITLGFTYNKEKIEAMPCFAYHALNSLGGEKLSWSNIMLGQDINDKLVISTADSKEVNLQSAKIHFLIAGSRSGKGVMGYNLFATALASKMPLFYIDGKPDTSVALKDMSPRAFAINHGNHDSDIDYNNKVLNLPVEERKIPSYLNTATLFSAVEKQNNFAALRTLLLLLSIPIYIDKANPADEIRIKAKNDISEILSEKGMIVVFDEITSYISFINEHFLNDGLMSKGIKLDKMKTIITDAKKSKGRKETELRKQREKKAIYEDYLKNPMDEKGKPKKEPEKVSDETIVDLEEEIKLFDLGVKPDSVYATQMYFMLNSSVLQILDLRNRSSGAWNKLHVFFIGQDFKSISYGSSVSSYGDGSGSPTKLYNKLSGFPLFGMLMSLQTDVIVGYQPERTSYMSQGRKGSITSKLFTPSRRFFAYKNMNGELTPNQIQTIMNNPSDAELKDWHFFKPFLILNNAVTPEEELAKHFNDTNVAKDIAEHDFYNRTPQEAKSNALEQLAKAKAPSTYVKEKCGESNFRYYESQYVAQCLYQSLKADIEPYFILNKNVDEYGNFHKGVGFKGYINMMSKDNNIEETLGLATDIANRFVLDIIGYPAKNLENAWMEFVFDFRPEWMYSCGEQFWDFITGTPKSLKDRLNIFSELPRQFKKEEQNSELFSCFNNDISSEDIDRSDISHFNSVNAVRYADDLDTNFDFQDESNSDFQDESNTNSKEDLSQTGKGVQTNNIDSSNQNSENESLEGLLKTEHMPNFMKGTETSIPTPNETEESSQNQGDNGKRINELLQETGIPNVSDIDDTEETENEEEFESDFDGDFGNVMSGDNETHKISINEFKWLTLKFVDKMVSDVCASLDVIMGARELGAYMMETRDKIYNDDNKLSVLIAYFKETYPDVEVDF